MHHKLVSTLGLSAVDYGHALQNLRRTNHLSIYRETDERARMRKLLADAARLDAEVVLAFVKLDGSMRYMHCMPQPDADPTCRYIIVEDLSLSEEHGRRMYRRVNLDTIAGVNIVYRAAQQ
ncbi:MAG: hypothetical protein ACK4K3_07365 [Aquabacterium sp.]